MQSDLIFLQVHILNLNAVNIDRCNPQKQKLFGVFSNTYECEQLLRITTDLKEW